MRLITAATPRLTDARLIIVDTNLDRGRVLDRFGEIVVLHRPGCVAIGFLPENTLDALPLPSQLGRTRLGGIDLNKPWTRSALTAVLALAAAPAGFTVKDLTHKVHAMTGHTDYTIRQAAYDLRKLRGKDLVTKPGRSRRYHLLPQPARIITALLTLRDQVIAPVLAGIGSPVWDANPPSGPASTATTRACASTCKPSSTTSASPPPEPLRHRQLFVDRGLRKRLAARRWVRAVKPTATCIPLSAHHRHSPGHRQEAQVNNAHGASASGPIRTGDSAPATLIVIITGLPRRVLHQDAAPATTPDHPPPTPHSPRSAPAR